MLSMDLVKKIEALAFEQLEGMTEYKIAKELGRSQSSYILLRDENKDIKLKDIKALEKLAKKAGMSSAAFWRLVRDEGEE